MTFIIMSFKQNLIYDLSNEWCLMSYSRGNQFTTISPNGESLPPIIPIQKNLKNCTRRWEIKGKDIYKENKHAACSLKQSLRGKNPNFLNITVCCAI